MTAQPETLITQEMLERRRSTFTTTTDGPTREARSSRLVVRSASVTNLHGISAFEEQIMAVNVYFEDVEVGQQITPCTARPTS